MTPVGWLALAALVVLVLWQIREDRRSRRVRREIRRLETARDEAGLSDLVAQLRGELTREVQSYYRLRDARAALNRIKGTTT